MVPEGTASSAYCLCDHLGGEPENRDQVENTAVTWALIELLTDFIPAKHVYSPILETLEETGLAVIARDQIGERTHPKTGRHMVYIAADPVNGTAVMVGDPDEYSEVGW